MQLYLLSQAVQCTGLWIGLKHRTLLPLELYPLITQFPACCESTASSSAATAALHAFITQAIYTWSVVWLQCIRAGVTRYVVTIRLCLGKAYTRRPGQHRWGATPTAPDADPVLHFTTGKLVVQLASDVP